MYTCPPPWAFDHSFWYLHFTVLTEWWRSSVFSRTVHSPVLLNTSFFLKWRSLLTRQVSFYIHLICNVISPRKTPAFHGVIKDSRAALCVRPITYCPPIPSASLPCVRQTSMPRWQGTQAASQGAGEKIADLMYGFSSAGWVDLIYRVMKSYITETLVANKVSTWVIWCRG